MSDNPLVSVVTPVQNGKKYLEECIQSALNQSYPHIEHIFVDGGSTDGTVDILSNYQSRYPHRIRFISEPDEGVGDALNKGYEMAKGDIFGWLDGDDIYLPDAVLSAVEFFRSNPDACYVFGGVNITNEAGGVIGKVAIKDYNFNRVVTGGDHISLTAAFYRREVIERVGTFNAIGNNLDFWLRVANKFQMHRIDRTLCTYRLHKGNFGFSKNAGKVEVTRQKLHQDYLLCRQYRGGIFAPRCRKYFIFTLLNKLGLYYAASDLIRILFGLRRYHFVDKLLGIAGL